MRFYQAVALIAIALVPAVAPVRAEQNTQNTQVEARIPRSGTKMAVGFNSLWLVCKDSLARISLSDHAITDIPAPGLSTLTLVDVVIGEDAVWVPSSTTLYKIDPQKNAAVREIAADNFGGGLTLGEGSVWAITGSQKNQLRRYSIESGAEEAMVPLPSRSSGLLAAFGSVWVTGTGNDELYRIDPATNQITATIDLRSDPGPLIAAEGSIWVLNGDGSVQRIDSNSGTVVATIETREVGIGTIVTGGGFVWAAIGSVPGIEGKRSGPIIQIDPQSNSIRSKFNVEREYPPIAYGGGSLWVSGPLVRRIKPPE